MAHQEDQEGREEEAPKRPTNTVKQNSCNARSCSSNYNCSGKSALLILNRNYLATTEWEVLPGVVEDGENMKEMLQNQGFEVPFVYKS